MDRSVALEERLEAIQDEINLLKDEVQQTLVDLREFMMRDRTFSPQPFQEAQRGPAPSAPPASRSPGTSPGGRQSGPPGGAVPAEANLLRDAIRQALVEVRDSATRERAVPPQALQGPQPGVPQGVSVTGRAGVEQAPATPFPQGFPTAPEAPGLRRPETSLPAPQSDPHRPDTPDEVDLLRSELRRALAELGEPVTKGRTDSLQDSPGRALQGAAATGPARTEQPPATPSSQGLSTSLEAPGLHSPRTSLPDPQSESRRADVQYEMDLLRGEFKQGLAELRASITRDGTPIPSGLLQDSPGRTPQGATTGPAREEPPTSTSSPQGFPVSPQAPGLHRPRASLQDAQSESRRADVQYELDLLRNELKQGLAELRKSITRDGTDSPQDSPGRALQGAAATGPARTEQPPATPSSYQGFPTAPEAPGLRSPRTSLQDSQNEYRRADVLDQAHQSVVAVDRTPEEPPPSPSPLGFPMPPEPAVQRPGISLQSESYGNEALDGEALDEVVLGNILRWLGTAKRRGLSLQQISPFLEAYEMSGHLTAAMARLVLRTMANLDDLEELPPNHTFSPQDYADCLLQFHHIICTPGYVVDRPIQTPEAQGPALTSPALTAKVARSHGADATDCSGGRGG